MERHVPARSDPPLQKRNCYNKFSKGGTGWNVTFPREMMRRCRNVTAITSFPKADLDGTSRSREIGHAVAET